MPVCVFAPAILRELGGLAAALPDLQLVVDHLGLPQPPLVPPDRPEPFGRLPELLSLARRPNVAVKLTGAPTLSRQRYPFADLWPHLHRGRRRLPT